MAELSESDLRLNRLRAELAKAAQESQLGATSESFNHDVYMTNEPEWTKVWESFTDERLEETLYHYRWLSVNTPNSYASRIDALIQECQRRGRSEIPERVQARCQQTD